MDIGLEVLNRGKVAVAVPSLEQMFDQYIGCEKLVADTDRFVAYGEQLDQAFENVWSLGKVAAKYNSTESLAVLNALVGSEFGGSFEAEEVKTTAKSIWQRIKEFFAKIWEWIKTFFYRVLNFFGGADKRLAKMEAEYKAVKPEEKCEAWKFKGAPIGLDNQALDKMRVGKMIDKMKAAADEEKVALFKAGAIRDLGKLAVAENSVDSKETALVVIGAARVMISDCKRDKDNAARAHNDNGQALKAAEGKEDIKAAKLAQKKSGAMVAIYNKKQSVAMRTVASIMANGKCRVVKAAEKK